MEARERLEKLLQRDSEAEDELGPPRLDADIDCCDGVGGHVKDRLESLYIRGRRKQEARKSSAFGGA